jgi:hypothetical protein
MERLPAAASSIVPEQPCPTLTYQFVASGLFSVRSRPTLPTVTSALPGGAVALPSYRDRGPSDSDVSAAISAANSAIASAEKAYAAHLAKAAGYDVTANKYASIASKACDQVP